MSIPDPNPKLNQYLDCVRDCRITTIHNDAELIRVIDYCRELRGKYSRATMPDGVSEFLETQSALILIYRKKREQMLVLEPAPDAVVFRYLLLTRRTLEEPPLTLDEVSNEFGMPVQFYQDVLDGKIELTREDISELARYMDVPITIFDWSRTCGVTPGRYRTTDGVSGMLLYDMDTRKQIPLPESLETLFFDYNGSTEEIRLGQRGYRRQLDVRLRDDEEIIKIAEAAFAEHVQ